MNYTIQSYVKRGISEKILKRQLKHLQDNAKKEIKKKNCSLEETVAWQSYQKGFGGTQIPLLNIKLHQLQALQTHINSSIERKLAFISNLILPRLRLYPKKLSCNPHQFIAFFNNAIGLSGTLNWNSKSMSHRLNPKPADGTDSETLLVLFEKDAHYKVIVIEEGSPKTMLEALIKSGAPADMVTDAGGYFKEGKNEQIAKDLADLTSRQVVCFNANGEKKTTDGKEFNGNKGAAFLDQARATGTNLIMNPTAEGFVTIGKDMLLRDLLQAVWRLRGIKKAQRIHFVITQEVEALIRQSISKAKGEIEFEDILAFVMKNQDDQKIRDNTKALHEDLWSIPQVLVLRALFHPKLKAADSQSLLAALEELWTEDSLGSPAKLYPIKEDKMKGSDYLIKEVKACRAYIERLFVQCPVLNTLGYKVADLLKETDIISANLNGEIAAEMPFYGMGDEEMTMELERETRKETQVQKEQQENAYKPTNELAIVLSDISEVNSLEEAVKAAQEKKLTVLPIDAVFRSNPALAGYQDAFKGLYMTFNVLQWSNDDLNYAVPILFGESRTRFHFILENEGKMIVLSQADAVKLREEVKWDFGQLPLTQLHVNYEKACTLDSVRLKFLSGECQYSKEEQKLLTDWLRQHNPKQMEALFQNHIVLGLPSKQEAYRHSVLEHIFNKVLMAK